MSRIVAGAARGRRLVVPAGDATRPTSDRAREGLFSSLAATLGAFAGIRVLDLYAGSGALGLEALSRGVAHVTFVESGQPALKAIRANLGTVGVAGGVVVADRVERFLAGPVPVSPFDVVLADPPYAVSESDLQAVLALLAQRGWLVAGGLVVVERSSRGGALSWPDGIEADRERRYGEATLWYGRRAPAGPSEPDGGKGE